MKVIILRGSQATGKTRTAEVLSTLEPMKVVKIEARHSINPSLFHGQEKPCLIIEELASKSPEYLEGLLKEVPERTKVIGTFLTDEPDLFIEHVTI